MNNFQLAQPATLQETLTLLNTDAQIIAGGTNLIDLMKKGITQAGTLIDINKLPLKNIDHANGVLKIGALALNSTVATHEAVQKKQPLLGQALVSGASPQLRNMATVGGNLLQRTRCAYFYDTAMPCNKRTPGSGCSALDGINRMHALFGASPQCIAVNPSDMSVALAALDASVQIANKKGNRTIGMQNFHRLPGNAPQHDTVLETGDLITGVDIPDNTFTHYHYLKVRDRASYAFALVSVAIALQVDGRTIRDVRIALGGVAHKPWRLLKAENELKGKRIDENDLRKAAALELKEAKSYKHNAFKLKLVPNAIVEAWKIATQTA